MKKILCFGYMKARTAITILFYVLIVPLAVKVFFASKILFGTINFYSENALSRPYDTGDILDTYVQNLNNPNNINLLGVNDLGSPLLFTVIFLAQLAISLVIWKLICELLLILFQHFEKNKGSMLE